MASFFKQFPLVDFIINNNINQVVNIFRNVDMNDQLADNITAYDYVDIIEGERPDHLSQRLYGTPNYYWTFFIVNDSLKNMLHDWPLSAAEFENNLELKYDPYAAIMIKPYVVATTYDTLDGPLDTGSRWMWNNIGSLDLNYTYLYVERNGATAKIKEWDSNRLLLIVYDFSDRDAFLADGNYPIILKVDEDNYTQNSEWRAWVKNLCQWRQDLIIDMPDITNDLPLDVFEDLEATYLNEDELNIEIYNTFMDPTAGGGYFNPIDEFDGYNIISFEPFLIYEDYRNAPFCFYDANDECIDVYTATLTDMVPTNYLTNYENEVEENNLKSKIKIVKKQYIADFANEFKRLINT